MINQRIRDYLDKTYLGWVILDFLAGPKLVSLMGRLNIEYRGVRTSSIPPRELAYDLAEEALLHPEIMDVLINVLNESVSSESQSLSQMSLDEIKALIRKPGELLLGRKLGKVIWALLIDLRQEVNQLLPAFLESVEEDMDKEIFLARKMEARMDKVESSLFSKKGFRKLEQAMVSLKERLAQGERFSNELLGENRRLVGKNTELHKLIQELRRSCGELAKEKGLLAKQIIRKDLELTGLQQQVKELKNKLMVGPKFRLKSDIHHLEKENSKLNYLLEKERQEHISRLSELEKELLSFKEKTRQLEDENSRQIAELESQRQSSLSLEKEYQLFLAKKNEPLALPKEKGKRLGIFIDNQNVYYSARMHYGKKIDYLKLLELIVRDRHLVKAVCYIVQKPEVSQERFINTLKGYGYTVRTRDLIQRADGSAKGNWDIGIAVDVLTMVEKNSLDIVSLVTCDGDFVDLIKLLSANKMRVEVVGFPMNTAMDLKKAADEYNYISEELMVE